MSHEPKTTIELDKRQNLKILSLEWTAERVGWLLIAISLVAALLGLLGPGPLSHRNQGSTDDQLAVEYYWMQRYEAPTQLRIRCQATKRDDDLVRIAISREFTDEITLDSITPEPVLEATGDKEVQYHFRLSELARDGIIVFRYHNSTFGRMNYEVTQDNGPSVKVSQFIFP